jgi:hypothetical protein
MRTLLAALAVLPLAACAAPPSQDGLLGGGLVSAPILSLPPQAGRVVGITERRAGGATIQTVALEADPGTVGQNQLVVTRHVRGALPRIRSDEIGAEMAAAMPGVPMSIAATTNVNGLGPFGYAMGRAGGETCLYGWQAVSGADVRQSLLDEPARPVSLRLRLCRTNAPASSLVAVMQGLGGGAGVWGAGLSGGAASYGQGDALAVAPAGLGYPAPLMAPPAMAAALPIPEHGDAPAPRPRRSRPASAATVSQPQPAAAAGPVALPGVTVPLPDAAPPAAGAAPAVPLPAGPATPLPQPVAAPAAALPVAPSPPSAAPPSTAPPVPLPH